MKMNRSLKIVTLCAFIQCALLVLLFVTSPLWNRTRLQDFEQPTDFKTVIDESLIPNNGELFGDFMYQGDRRFVRFTTTRSPKEVVSLLEKSLKSADPTQTAMDVGFDLGPHNQAVAFLKCPPIPNESRGDCQFIRKGAMGYSLFYVWPEGNGGTVLEVIEGYED